MTADRIIQTTAAATVIGIAAIAAYISYRHALGVAERYGEHGVTARLLPLTIDGLVLVAALVLLDAARREQPAPALAKVALTLGIGGTIAVNVLHGIDNGPVGAVVAAWPAVCLVVTVELLMGMIRRSRAAIGQPPRDTDHEIAPVAEPAALAPVTIQDPLVDRARDHFAEVLATGQAPSVRSIRRELRVGHPRAVRLRDALEDNIAA